MLPSGAIASWTIVKFLNGAAKKLADNKHAKLILILKGHIKLQV
jgi:hypothetical protein